MSQSIRRVLSSRAVARCCASGGHPSTTYVAARLQRPTRELGRAALERSLSDLAPGGVYRAAPVARHAGGLLHHRFTLTGPADRTGGLFSVALSRGSPRVGVTHHPALRSPDVPRHRRTGDAAAWLTRPRPDPSAPAPSPARPPQPRSGERVDVALSHRERQGSPR